MNHLHFKSISSTQTFLKEKAEELLKTDPEILITCDEQTHGIGRHGNEWIHNPHSLAMSCTLAPANPITLTTIEIGILTREYFFKKYQKEIFLKWPNDLLSVKKQKLGGIISNFHDELTIIVGIGINFGKLEIKSNHFKSGLDSIEFSSDINIKNFALNFYHYLLHNRLSKPEIIEKFHQHCAHLNQEVTIETNHGEKFNGIFLGIDEEGAALINHQGKITEIISGQLLMN